MKITVIINCVKKSINTKRKGLGKFKSQIIFEGV